MPAVAAHYQFGQLVLAKLDAETRRAILADKPSFDMGLQGPDIFFYNNPFKKNNIVKYGQRLHRQSGGSLLGPAPAGAAAADGRGLAYVLGVCCHYALDRACHPFIIAMTPNSTEHADLEADFELDVIRQYGLSRRRHIYIPRARDIAGAEALYPGLTAREVRGSMRAMRFFTRLLESRRPALMAARLSSGGAFFLALTLKGEDTRRTETAPIGECFRAALKDAEKMVTNVCKAYSRAAGAAKAGATEAPEAAAALFEGAGINFEGEETGK